MEYTIEHFRRTVLPEGGGKIFVSLCVPQFTDEKLTGLYTQAKDKVIAFYENVRLAENISRLSLSADCRVTLCTDEAVSLYFDIRRYAAETLVSYFRVAQNWEIRYGKNGTSELLCAAKPTLTAEVKKEAKRTGVLPPDGFCRTGSEVFLFRNTFTSGDGEGLRRSKQEEFIRKYSFPG